MLKQMNLFRANPIGVVRVGVVGVGFVALLLGVSGAVNVVVAASRTLSAATYVDKQTQTGLTAGRALSSPRVADRRTRC
jgi:hypothetical protein